MPQTLGWRESRRQIIALVRCGEIAGGDEKWCSYLGNSLTVPQKVKQLQCDPAILLLGIYSKEMKTCIHTNTCAQISAAAFTVAKSGNNPNVHQLMNG